MQSFTDYIKESEELLEAVHPEMYEIFTRVEIQELGRKLARLGVSMQNSEIQPWGPKGFKLKVTKEHRVHIVKIKGYAGYVMLYYVNARSADIIDNTTGIDFKNSKEVYARAQKVFTFNTVVDTKKLLDQRWISKYGFIDPLKRNQNTREDRLEQLKADKAKKSYAFAVMRNLAEYYKIKIEGLKAENGKCYYDSAEVTKKFKHILPEIIHIGLQEKPVIKISLKDRSITGRDEIVALIDELQDLVRPAEALENLDIKKLAS